MKKYAWIFTFALLSDVLFSFWYDCGLLGGQVGMASGWRCSEYPFGYSFMWGTFVLTFPLWLLAASLVWLFFRYTPTLRVADRVLYAVGIDTRRIAARWKERK